ncbi:MAG: rhomboid family intramembrane serine protease [Microthrixaceae bacterium]
MTEVSEACYRHPDRFAAVTCQRCGRPICTRCMTQAAVGFQCPSCVGANPQQVVSRAQLFRGHGEVNAGKVIIALNAAMFLVTAVTGGSAISPSGPVFERFVLYGPFVVQGEWWRLVTGGFMHSSLIHIGSNMLLLWFLAQEMEPVLGKFRFSLLYGASLMGGSLGVMVMSPVSPTLGASGAVFGLMGGLIALQLRAHHNPWNSGIGGLVLLNLILTFAIPGISVGGHIGGLLAGAAAGAVIQPLSWSQKDAPQRNAAVVALAVGLAVLSVLAADHFVRSAVNAHFGIPG